MVTPGGPIRTWNTTFSDVRGLDASRGDRLLLATRIDLLNARFYAAALSPSGTVTDSYFVTAPSTLDPDGIGTSTSGSVLVGGFLGDDVSGTSVADIYRHTGDGTVTGLGLPGPADALYGTLGCLAAYRSDLLRLRDLCTDTEIGAIPNPFFGAIDQPRLIPGSRVLGITTDANGLINAAAFSFTGAPPQFYAPDPSATCTLPASGDAID